MSSVTERIQSPPVTAESLCSHFNAVQEVLILSSRINLDYRGHQDAKVAMLAEVLDALRGDALLLDILAVECDPAEAFLCYARREIAIRLVGRFGIDARELAI
ncbi:hypothetical protein FJZ28_03940 [Candidatus Peregrinibacteria bacterium]|nr:hypothetical protein [Candidatus Peregrinibacteria bacterium]